MEAGIYITVKTLWIAAIVAALIAGVVILILLVRRARLRRSLPARGMEQPREYTPRPRSIPQSAPAPTPSRLCGRCGYAVEVGDEYCLQCGSKL